MGIKSQTPRAHQSAFRILKLTELPQLPQPSPQLQEILRLAGSAPSVSRRQVRRKSGSRKKKRRINGFIAFRCFYSRAAKSSQSQKELSTSLGKIWESEPNRNIWNCYALHYNETGEDEEFMDWLYRNLKLANGLPLPKQVVKPYPSHINSNVEDVFLES